jgi:hypothetical protein
MNDLYNMNEAPAPDPSLPKPTRPAVPVALLVVLGVLVILVALLAIDPFRWNVFGNVKALLGLGGDPVAASIPARTSLYMGVDLLNATPEKLNRLYKPFADAVGTGSPDSNTAIQDLNTQMKESLGLTFTEDVVPWIGKTAGLALTDLKIDSSGPTEVGLVFSVASRDNQKADEFIQKLKSGVEKQSSAKMTVGAYQGVNIYTLKSNSSSSMGQGISFGRSGDVVLFSLKESGVMDAVDAQKGESLSKDKNYQVMMDQLPKDRFMSVYFPAQKMKDLLLALFDSAPSDAYSGFSPEQLKATFSETYDKASGLAASLTIVDAGLQIDSLIAYNLDKLTALEKSGIQQGKAAVKAVEMLPAETLLFIGAKTMKETWATLRDQVIKNFELTPSEYDQAMSELEKQIQVNPEKDLFPILGGDMLIAVAPSTRGLLPMQANVNLGLALVIETSDSAKMMTAVEKFSGVIGEQLLGSPLALTEASGLKYYGAKYPGSDAELFALGVGKQYLVAGTSSDLLEGLFTGKSPLSSSSRYQSAVKALPGGAVPFLYLDLEGMLAKIRASMTGTTLQSFEESMKSVKPLPMMIAGNSTLSDSLVKSTVVLFVTPLK